MRTLMYEEFQLRKEVAREDEGPASTYPRWPKQRTRHNMRRAAQFACATHKQKSTTGKVRGEKAALHILRYSRGCCFSAVVRSAHCGLPA